MNHIINKQESEGKSNRKLVFVFLAFLLSTFCILKVIRGSDVQNTTAGGIWNYISLLYYPIFLISIAFKKNYKIDITFVSAFLYSFFAFVFAVTHLTPFKINIGIAYQLLMLPYPLLVFFTFYLCAEETKKGETIILIGYIVCLALNLQSYLSSSVAGDELAMKSDIYFSLGLFPFALQFIKKKPLRLVIIALQFIAVFFANKRTGLISFVISLVLYFIINSYVEDKSKIVGTIKTLVISTIAIVAFYYIGKYFDNKYDLEIFNRLENIEEDGGSGRSDIYIRVWQAFKESTFIEKLIGHGISGVAAVGGSSHAHNDFLEILYNYGILNVFFVIIFYLSLIVKAIKLIKNKSPYAATFTLSVVSGVFLAMFSFFIIFYTYVTCTMAFWGYTIAMNNKRSLSDGGNVNERT